MSIPATYHRPSTGILTLIETCVTTNTGVSISTVNIIGASRLLDTETILTAVKRRTLTVILTLADAASSITELVIQTVSAALTRRGADTEAAEHATGTLLLCGAQLQLGTAQGGLPSKPRQTEAPMIINNNQYNSTNFSSSKISNKSKG